MSEPGTFERILAEIGQALLPLRDGLATPAAFSALLRRLGWTATTIPQPFVDLRAAVETLYDSLHTLLGDGGLNVDGTVGDGGASAAVSFSPDDVKRALGAVQALIKGIQAIAGAPPASIPDTLRADGFLTLFPGQLLDHLVITYLQRYHPNLGFVLRSLGVVKAGYAPPTGNRPPYVHLALDLGDLPRTLADPAQVLKDAFGWGTDAFDQPALLSQLDNLLRSIGANVDTERLAPTTALAVQGATPDPLGPRPRTLAAVLFQRVQPSAEMAAAIRLLPLPATADGGPPGLALLPSFTGRQGFRFELGPDIAVTIRGDLDLQGGVALLVRPGRGVDMVLGFESSSAPVHAKGSIDVQVERFGPTDQPRVLFGEADGTRLQVRRISGAGGVRLVRDAVDFFAEFGLEGLEFVLSPAGADGFVGAVLPADGFTLGADLTVGLSYRQGFYFRGTSNLEIQLPAHLELGPLEIQGLTISASPDANGLPIGLGVSFRAQLGPITAVVEQVGLNAELAFRSDGSGNLGPVDLSFGFRPPKGVGLSVDAGAVKGGGFLSFDPDRGEYAGALDLEFAGLVELKAVGLISTRMPDGTDGFSLLVVITTDFGATGIQLGYGFTLLAVGGLIGLNRSMNLQALVEGVRTGAVQSVMFPKDVIANAPRILSDLARYFPPEQGRFLIGPMAKIGWGTPTLVSVSLGVVIEIPPGDIAVLGVLQCLLPSADLPLLALQVAFVGALEVDKSRLWFFATLFDSHVLTMTIDGGMGLLVAWGDAPDFVLTVGGFHPSFKPPPLPFPVPARLTVDILNRPGQLIRVSGYFAVTSNTVQFGAAAELRLGFGGFGVEGHLSFDALFRFSPFAFTIAISAGVTLKAFGVGVFGIDLNFALEGPAPWRAHGRGSISLLFFEISADFDITWGEEHNTTLPPVAVLPLLAGEFDKIESWQTQLPSGGVNPLVTLRHLPDTDQLVLHPLGTLFVRQRAVPLDVRLDRIGAQRPSDGRRFGITPAPDSGLARVSVTGEKFAMAQFQDMDDAAKLSRPAYENQDSGLELTAAAGTLLSPRVVRRSARYELHVIDSGVPATAAAARRVVPMAARSAVDAPKRFHDVSPAVFNQLLQGSSTSRSPISQRETRLRRPFPVDETVQLTDRRFVVANIRNNVQAHPPAGGLAAATFRSRATAEDALADWIAQDGALAGQLHVIPEEEAVGSPAAPGGWASVGSLPTPARDIEAVRLANGKVLIAGGADATGTALAAAALFDPVAAAWTAAPSPATARRRHSTTRLGDGRVVLTGGRGADGGTLGTTEIYDPAPGTWSSAGALTTARHGHTATALPDGRLLVAGGTDADGRALGTVELLDPTTGAWSATGPAMTDARTGHRAVLLTDGRVLVVGGALPTGGPDAATAYCELYDPVARTWTPTGSLLTARKGHRATLLSDGRVLVTGGDPAPGPDRYDPRSLATAEVWDRATGAWTALGPLPGGGRRGHHCLALRSGQVLLIGGTGTPSLDTGFRHTALLDPTLTTWTTTGPLATGRTDFAAVELADGRVLATGGTTRSGPAAPGPDPVELAAADEAYVP
ncbi:DUF6603 domain-containing protein [Kitasatospora griseola]|uniref:DUF6603 domain-containing protein n=1 Tax=Kitasatospora griseola TaxID=2064 RepID=UPI001670370F|nr:DUF6603 domain-containing protein [Kitasatospora griseola]GGQ54158.1 hypothetical protein GCM10010195_07000 [Kitasatospora griseola]